MLHCVSYFFLASLCSVADVTITTKTKNDDVSCIYTINKEGDITEKKPSHLGQGIHMLLQFTTLNP